MLVNGWELTKPYPYMIDWKFYSPGNGTENGHPLFILSFSGIDGLYLGIDFRKTVVDHEHLTVEQVYGWCTERNIEPPENIEKAPEMVEGYANKPQLLKF